MSAIDPTRPFPFNPLPLSLTSILTTDPPPVDWIVRPFLSVGDRALFYGEWGSFKSWLLLDLALSIAVGAKWLGVFDVPKPRAVLYIDEEMGQARIHRRVRRLADGAGIKAPDVDRFHSISHPGLRFDNEGAGKILAYCKLHGLAPEVIFVEGLRRVIVGSENEATDVAGMWNRLRPLILDNKAVVLSHHMRKPTAEGHNSPRYRASGSTDLQAGIEDALSVERKSPDTVLVYHIKSRDEAEEPPFLVHAELGRPRSQDPVVLSFAGTYDKAAREAEGQVLEDEIAAFLLTQPDRTASTGTIVARASERTSQVRRTIERTLARMEGAGTLDKPAHGQYRLTDPPAEPEGVAA